MITCFGNSGISERPGRKRHAILIHNIRMSCRLKRPLIMLSSVNLFVKEASLLIYKGNKSVQEPITFIVKEDAMEQLY